MPIVIYSMAPDAPSSHTVDAEVNEEDGEVSQIVVASDAAQKQEDEGSDEEQRNPETREDEAVDDGEQDEKDEQSEAADDGLFKDLTGTPARLNLRKASGLHPEAPRRKQPNAKAAQEAETLRQHKIQEEIDKLVAKEDYAGAAVLAAGVVQTSDVTPPLVSAAIAAKAAEEAEALRRRKLQEEIDKLVAKQEYAGAAVLAAGMVKTCDVAPASVSGAIAAKAVQEAEAIRRQKAEKEISELVAKQDYAGAALLAAAMKEPSSVAPKAAEEGKAAGFAEQAESRRVKQIQEDIAKLLAKRDFAGAAILKAKMGEGKGVALAPRAKQEVNTSIAELLRPGTVLRTLVRLEGVRLLSFGKKTSGSGGGKDQWALQHNENPGKKLNIFGKMHSCVCLCFLHSAEHN